MIYISFPLHCRVNINNEEKNSDMKTKFSALLICLAVLLAPVSFAQVPAPQQQEQQQIEVSDAELEKFAQAYQRIRLAEQQAQQEMIAIVENHDLEIQTFNEIHQAKMQNQPVTASEEDQKKHSEAVAEIEGMQPEIQANMEEIITNQDLTVERYRQIANALQANQELQQRLQQIMTG